MSQLAVGCNCICHTSYHAGGVFDNCCKCRFGIEQQKQFVMPQKRCDCEIDIQKIQVRLNKIEDKLNIKVNPIGVSFIKAMESFINGKSITRDMEMILNIKNIANGTGIIFTLNDITSNEWMII